MSLPLIDYIEAGYKQRGSTSEFAAKAVTPGLRKSHQLVLDAFHQRGSMTADQCAEMLGRSILYVRPRISELRKRGLLHATGQKRANASGLPAEILSC